MGEVASARLRRTWIGLVAVALVAASLLLVQTPSFAAPGDLAFGTVIVDAQKDGAVDTSGAPGTVDLPLAGATVTLHGSVDPSAVLATATTDANGAWHFAPADAGSDPGPYTVTVDAAGVAADAYAAEPTGAFAAVAGKPQQQTATVGTAPSELDALVYPAWAFDLALANDPAGYQGKSVYTGSPTFDSSDGVGEDSSASNGRVRTADVINYNWSITTASDSALGASFSAAKFEQTITLGAGAVASFARIPAVCASGSSSIVAQPSGTVLAAREDPPAGTTSVTLTCDLGSMGEDRAAILLPTSVWISDSSSNGSQVSTDARVYAVDDGGAATAQPSDGVQNGPIDITAAPRYDLSKSPIQSVYGEARTIGGVRTPGYDIYYTVRVATDRKVGVEALRQPITFTDQFWAQHTSTAGQTGPDGSIVPDLQFYMDTCIPTARTQGLRGEEVWGTTSATQPGSKSVVDSGTCSFARGSDPTALGSGAYTLTLNNVDMSGTSYPTQTLGGSDLTAGPFYVADFLIRVWVPASELDRAEGAATDGAGELSFYNRLDGFDPTGVGGTSNYGSGTEPGYCAPAGPEAGSTQCAAMEDGTRSNDVSGPYTLRISPGNWAKYDLDEYTAWGNGEALLPGMTSSHDGTATIQPGEAHSTRVALVNTGVNGLTGVQQCDVFDNTVARLAPMKDAVLNDAASLPPDLYSYVIDTTNNDTSPAGIAAQQAFNSNFVIEYAHVDLTGDTADNGTFDTATNRWEGDWTQQKQTTCSDVPAGDWVTDPTQVPGGLDAVNVVRMRAVDGYALPAGVGLRWWLSFTQRDTFNGGPNAGNSIPAGTVFANFARVRTDQWLPDWNNADYIPGAGTTDGVARAGENGSAQGDRWTVTRALMALKKRTVTADIGGVQSSGASDFGQTGSAVAGKPIVWEIVPTLSADSTTAAPVQDVVITDTLPKYAVYDEAATAAVAGGTPASSYTVNADGTTTLVWNLGALTPNQPIAPRRIVTGTDPLAPPNTSLVNTATITADGIVPLSTHTDTHTVVLEQTGEVQLKKSVDQTLDLQDDTQKYTLQVKNFSDTLAIQAPTVIEVLPYNGDAANTANVKRAPSSAYSGSNTLAAAPEAFQFDGTTPTAGTFYYTTVPGARVPQNLNDDTDPSIWSTTFTPNATGIKFVADTALAPTGQASASGLTITFTTQQAGNAAGDLYADRFTAFSQTLRNGGRYQLLTSNQTTVRVVGFSLGDLVWIEKDGDGVYTPGVDDHAPKGVKIDVYDDADHLVAHTTTDDNGRWVVNDLPTGSYYAVIPASELAAGGPLESYAAYSGGVADPNNDANEDADHNGLPDGARVRTGAVTLSADVNGSTLTGNEPLGDNVGGVTLSPLTTDAFTNLTLDIALRQTHPGYEFTKTSDPASGTAVNPGGTITYTLTGTNTGDVDLATVVNDDLSKVLDHAAVVGDPVATISGGAGGAIVPTPTITGTALAWHGTLAPGEAVVITYQVKLASDAAGVIVNNHASSTATPPTGPQITPPDVVTHHPTPGYAFAKTSDPASGTTVHPGDTITYTLTGSNTGKTVLDPVTVSDDLSQVLDHAGLVGSPVATIDGASDVPAPTLTGTTLNWSGTLAAGQAVVITYQVKLAKDAAGVIVNNHAGSTATPPGLPTITPPDQETHHPTPLPQGTPSIVTATSRQRVQIGGKVSDRVTISGFTPGAGARGTVTLYGPYASRGSATCGSGQAVATVSFTPRNGTVDAPAVRVTEPGYYTWVASLSADARNKAVSHPCGLAAETTLVHLPSYPVPEVKAGYSGTVSMWGRVFTKVLARAATTQLDLPALGIHAKVATVGISHGSVNIPGDVAMTGRLGASAGIGDVIGSTVIAGHVSDEHDSPGAFWRLSRAHRGQRISVVEQGVVHRFRVVSSTTYRRDGHRLPATLFSTLGRHQLVLISCTGKVVRPDGHFHYTRNRVVVAVPIR